MKRAFTTGDKKNERGLVLFFLSDALKSAFVFVRLDILYADVLPTEMIRAGIRGGTADVFVPSWGYTLPGGYNDRFAVARAASAWPIANRRLFWRSFVDARKTSVHAEQLLHFVANSLQHKMKVKLIDFAFNRVRGHTIMQAKKKQGSFFV